MMRCIICSEALTTLLLLFIRLVLEITCKIQRRTCLRHAIFQTFSKLACYLVRRVRTTSVDIPTIAVDRKLEMALLPSVVLKMRKTSMTRAGRVKRKLFHVKQCVYMMIRQ
jgi:hypothetical protein